jgi:peroxiredoxin
LFDSPRGGRHETSSAAASLKTVSRADKISCTLVSDPRSKVIEACNVPNAATRGKARFEGIAIPAIFVIGADGKVQAKHDEDGYSRHPPGRAGAQHRHVA